ncbi:hypothetical protein LTR94_037334, partial [Friedmanniomyces endolithicus]
MSSRSARLRLDRSALLELAHEWIGFWQGRPLEDFASLHHPAFIDHASADRETSLAAFQASIEDLYRAFPDFRAEIEDVAIDEAASKITIR